MVFTAALTLFGLVASQLEWITEWRSKNKAPKTLSPEVAEKNAKVLGWRLLSTSTCCAAAFHVAKRQYAQNSLPEHLFKVAEHGALAGALSVIFIYSVFIYKRSQKEARSENLIVTHQVAATAANVAGSALIAFCTAAIAVIYSEKDFIPRSLKYAFCPIFGIFLTSYAVSKYFEKQMKPVS
jgi:hypothetical protein